MSYLPWLCWLRQDYMLCELSLWETDSCHAFCTMIPFICQEAEVSPITLRTALRRQALCSAPFWVPWLWGGIFKRKWFWRKKCAWPALQNAAGEACLSIKSLCSRREKKLILSQISSNPTNLGQCILRGKEQWASTPNIKPTRLLSALWNSRGSRLCQK